MSKDNINSENIKDAGHTDQPTERKAMVPSGRMFNMKKKIKVN